MNSWRCAKGLASFFKLFYDKSIESEYGKTYILKYLHQRNTLLVDIEISKHFLSFEKY